MLREARELGRLIAIFGGSVVASLLFLVYGARWSGPPPESWRPAPDRPLSPYVETLVSDSQRYRTENLSLKCQLADATTERDAMRRELMRSGGVWPCGGAEVVPEDRIPPQQLPVLPLVKE